MTLTRSDVSFSEIGIEENTVTFKLTGLDSTMIPSGDPNNPDTFKPGAALVATDDGEAGLGSDDDRLLGLFQTISPDALIGGVQVGMFCKFAYSGSAPSVNDSVVVDGAGNVKTAGAANNTVVVSVDETNGWVTVLIR